MRFLQISWWSKNVNSILQSLNQIENNLKPRFLIKSGYHIVPSPSTSLISRMIMMIRPVIKNLMASFIKSRVFIPSLVTCVHVTCIHVNVKRYYPQFYVQLVYKPYLRKIIYHRRVIITCDLYTLYPLFEVHLCTVTFGLMYG